MLRFALLSTIVSTSCRETEARGHDVSAVPCDINSATLVPTSLCNFQLQSALVCVRRATRPGLLRCTCTPVCLTKALEPRPGTKALEPSHETMYASPRRSGQSTAMQASCTKAPSVTNMATCKNVRLLPAHGRQTARAEDTHTYEHQHVCAICKMNVSTRRHAWHMTGCNRFTASMLALHSSGKARGYITGSSIGGSK